MSYRFENGVKYLAQVVIKEDRDPHCERDVELHNVTGNEEDKGRWLHLSMCGLRDYVEPETRRKSDTLETTAVKWVVVALHGTEANEDSTLELVTCRPVTGAYTEFQFVTDAGSYRIGQQIWVGIAPVGE